MWPCQCQIMFLHVGYNAPPVPYMTSKLKPLKKHRKFNDHSTYTDALDRIIPWSHSVSNNFSDFLLWDNWWEIVYSSIKSHNCVHYFLPKCTNYLYFRGWPIMTTGGSSVMDQTVKRQPLIDLSDFSFLAVSNGGWYLCVTLIAFTITFDDTAITIEYNPWHTTAPL